MVKSFWLELPMWMAHCPGQHYDVRLTAPDGYRAQRSYSVASSPLDRGVIELTIDRLADGEVSPYFHDVVVEGDQVEVRGPFTSYFVWRGERPVLLIGGGSGVVPLMAMLRHRRRTEPDSPMRLVYSVRTAADVIFADELGDDAVITFTREPPGGLDGPHREDRFGDARRRRSERRCHGVHLWLERVRRERQPARARGRLRAGADPHRALRTNGLNDRSAEILRRLRAVPPGFVTTYGDLSPGAPRNAGRVLADCHDPSVPWQRAVRADGSLAKGGRQRRLLEAEGVPFRGARVALEVARVPAEALDELAASDP